MCELRSGMSRDGDDLGPDPARDVRYLNRAHRRASVRHNQHRVALAHDRRDRLSDEVAVNAELDHPHGEGAGGESTPAHAVRSEEHTSELQSLTKLVCRLL